MHAQLCKCILQFIHNWNKCFHSRISRHFLSSLISIRSISLNKHNFSTNFFGFFFFSSYLFLRCVATTAFLLLPRNFFFLYIVVLYDFTASSLFLWVYFICLCRAPLNFLCLFTSLIYCFCFLYLQWKLMNISCCVFFFSHSSNFFFFLLFLQLCNELQEMPPKI